MLRSGLGRRKRLLSASVGIAVFCFVVVPLARAASESSVGYDISWPQCNAAFPSGGAFAIVGVNGGKPYGVNPCLGTGDGPSELSWAGMEAELYANTADPGPALSSHWPNGQTSPKQCNTAANPGSDTSECHYDYGWNAAADSYRDAVDAYVSLGWAQSGATRTPVANQWWLDVETANSWTSTPGLNVQALLGELDYLDSVAVAGVGFYASRGDWQTITASTTTFASSPTWLAGATSLSDAQSRCGGVGFTGGGVALVQYPSGGFDGDYGCGTQPTLSFTSAAQTLTAGAPSGPMSVQLSQPASAGMTLTLASSSIAGTFATSTAGAWSSSLSLPLAAGGTSSTVFYYQDTKAGAPTLTANTAGYTDATQQETVGPAALSGLTISPSSVQLRVGTSTTVRAAGSDRFGNAVTVTPTWSVSRALGKFSPNPGNPTSFSATTVGTGTITATSGPIAGSASISVLAKKRRGAATTTRSSSRGGLPPQPKCSVVDTRRAASLISGKGFYHAPLYLRYCGPARAVINLNGRSYSIHGGWCKTRVAAGTVQLAIGLVTNRPAAPGRGILLKYPRQPGRITITDSVFELPAMGDVAGVGTVIVNTGLKGGTFKLQSRGATDRTGVPFTGSWACGELKRV